VLEREVDARDASGAQLRIKAAGFPTRKTIDGFSFDHQPALKRETIAHLTTGAFLATAQNVVLLGPPGTGKTHLPVGLGVKAAQAGHRVLFATAIEWVRRLQTAHNAARLTDERLGYEIYDRQCAIRRLDSRARGSGDRGAAGSRASETHAPPPFLMWP
jgi:DNA replication protein DnaC